MMRRIFIAIPVEDTARAQLLNFQKEYSELPAKWVKPENLHSTLEFLGNRSEKEVGEICQVVQEIASRHNPFIVTLEHISYGPPGKKPSVVWATGRASDEYLSLSQDLKNIILASDDIISPIESRDPSLHVTLARIRRWEFQRLSEEEQPDVSKKIQIRFPVRSISVMESILKPRGPQYITLQEAKLR